jgi:hypothetical protein
LVVRGHGEDTNRPDAAANHAAKNRGPVRAYLDFDEIWEPNVPPLLRGDVHDDGLGRVSIVETILQGHRKGCGSSLRAGPKWRYAVTFKDVPRSREGGCIRSVLLVTALH